MGADKKIGFRIFCRSLFPVHSLIYLLLQKNQVLFSCYLFPQYLLNIVVTSLCSFYFLYLLRTKPEIRTNQFCLGQNSFSQQCQHELVLTNTNQIKLVWSKRICLVWPGRKTQQLQFGIQTYIIYDSSGYYVCYQGFPTFFSLSQEKLMT